MSMPSFQLSNPVYLQLHHGMLVIPFILGMVTSLTNGIHRSSGQNHKMIVGDGRGPNKDRRSQLRPKLRLNLHFRSEGFSFWSSRRGKDWPLEQPSQLWCLSQQKMFSDEETLEDSPTIPPWIICVCYHYLMVQPCVPSAAPYVCWLSPSF